LNLEFSAIPSTGIITIIFPTGYTFASTPVITSESSGSVIDGAFAVAESGTTLTITRSGGTDTSAAASHVLRATHIVNPSTGGETDSFQISTKTSADVALDQVLSGVTATLSSSGILSAGSITLSRTEKGAIGAVSIAFTTITEIPADGGVKLTLPSDFTFTGVSAFTASGGMDGAYSANTTGQIAQVWRDGTGSAAAAGSAYTVTFNSITNPGTAGTYSGFQIETVDPYDLLDTSETITISATVLDTGALNGVTLSLSSATTSTVVVATVDFTTSTAIPADGKIIIVFPSEFSFPADSRRSTRTVTSVSGGTYTQLDGALAVSVTGTTVTVTRSGGSSTTGGQVHSLQITNVETPSNTGTTSSLSLTTTDAGGTTLDAVSSGVTFTIAECPSSCTSQGSCTNGTCLCDTGYYSDDCSGVLSDGYMTYATQDSYAIDWNTVPTTQPSQPSFSETKLTEGTCSCDITYAVCDNRCCCDSDCTTAQVALFSDACVEVNNVTAKPRQCIDKDFVVYFNPSSGMEYTRQSYGDPKA